MILWLRVTGNKGLEIATVLKKNFLTMKHLVNRNSVIPCRDCTKCNVGETTDFVHSMYQHGFYLRVENASSALHQHRSENNYQISNHRC